METQVGRRADRDDATIHKHIVDELAFEPRVEAGDVGIAVKDGVVTLGGIVHSLPQRWAAEEAVKRVAGVAAIANDLVVEISGDHRRDDADIAAAASHVLAWHPHLDDVAISVENGVITLSGTADWQYQRLEAEASVMKVRGVRAINNQMAIRDRVRPVDLRAAIHSHLDRIGATSLDALRIEVEEGTVGLSGEVPSWTAFEAAERAAWSVPGVTKVVNRIAVTPY